MSAATHTLADTRTLLHRDMVHALRYPAMSLSTLMMPLIFLLLFTYVFGSTSAQVSAAEATSTA